MKFCLFVCLFFNRQDETCTSSGEEVRERGRR